MSISWLNLLLPGSCVLCGAQTHKGLCVRCAPDMPWLSGPCCPHCAFPLPAPAPACGKCLQRPPAFDAAHAALRYAFPVDRLVHGLKFARRLAIADFFSACMLRGPHPLGDLILPVPLSAPRLRERGFNQALQIARPLARALRLPLDKTSLVRVRDTVPQSLLPWRTRHSNVRRAFACSADVCGKTVILVDDVMTSGATLDAAARALKDQGATRVVAWVAARAVKGGSASSIKDFLPASS